jgi:effector-binding domain-containing protein
VTLRAHLYSKELLMRNAIVLGLVLAMSATLCGEEKPATTPAIGEMRIQVMPAQTYLYTPVETSFEKIGEPVGDAFRRIFEAAVEAKLLIVRPTMMVYQENPHINFDPAKKFKVDVGVIVEDQTQAIGDLKVRKTEPFKCATIMYTGHVTQQGKAYEKLIPALKAAGLTPTGEEREMCLFWEGPESHNNVFLMQIGIK